MIPYLIGMMAKMINKKKKKKVLGIVLTNNSTSGCCEKTPEVTAP